jgi:hypothetical protein
LSSRAVGLFWDQADYLCRAAGVARLAPAVIRTLRPPGAPNGPISG